MGKCLPGSARHVGATELSGELVKVIRRTVTTFAQHELKCLTITLALGKFGNGGGHGIPQRGDSRNHGGVVDILSDTTIEDETLTSEHS